MERKEYQGRAVEAGGSENFPGGQAIQDWKRKVIRGCNRTVQIIQNMAGRGAKGHIR